MRRFFSTLLILFCVAGVHALQPSRGYRGFIDWSNDVQSQRVANWLNPEQTVRETSYFTGLTTSHGYQINRMFFAGIGAGLERCNSIQQWLAPVFVQGRADFLFGKFTPFADIRLGANLTDGAGVYFSPSVGYRFNWGRKMGVNLGLGMSVIGYRLDLYDIVNVGEYNNLIKVGDMAKHRVTFSFRVGIDF